MSSGETGANTWAAMEQGAHAEAMADHVRKQVTLHD